MRLIRGVGGLGTTLAAGTALSLILIGTPAGAATIPDFGTDPVNDISSPQGSTIADVRVGANDGFDRFVVEFSGEVGSYFVSYVTQISEDGTGNPVAVDGEALIQVSIGGIPNDPPAPQDTINADLPGLIQVVGAGAGFEGTVSYGLGTAQADGFRAFTLTDPSRLVVDIAYPNVVPTATNTVDPTASATSDEDATSDASDVTPVDASGESDGSDTWLLFLVVGLVVFAIVAGILGWRMRRPIPPRH